MRVAVVGCGGAGSQHIRAYQGLSDVTLVGVCDVDPERARRQAETTSARAYADAEAMLAAEKPDLVSVCTAEYGHVDVAIQALRAGCHVFCEKPMAHSVEMAERMVDTAREVGKVLGVDYNYRHIPVFRALREEIERESFGTVLLVNVTAHAFCYHHSIDLIRFLFGQVVEVCASINDVPSQRNYAWHTPDAFLYVPSLAAATILRMRSGATVVLTASRLRDLGDTMLDLEIIGTRMRLALRSLPVSDVRPRQVEAWPQSPEWATRFGLVPDGASFSLSDSFGASIAAFVCALKAGDPVPTDGSAGLAVLRLEQAIVHAYRFGTTVRLLG